jgi:hypothetical protein
LGRPVGRVGLSQPCGSGICWDRRAASGNIRATPPAVRAARVMDTGPDGRPGSVRPVTDDRPASECGMSPSAHEPPVGEPVPAMTSPALRAAEHLSIAEARDLLDWLQGHGISAQEVTLEPDGTMTVRWPGQP